MQEMNYCVRQNMSDVSNVIRYDRLRYGNYYADFRRDKRLQPEIYHCIIQRDGSSEILGWSQYRSLDAAARAAEKHLQYLAKDAA
jgi:hypothetical protein